MAKAKTTPTNRSVKDFINEVDNETKRADSFRLIGIFTDLTGFEPKMWGPSIVGFGSYHYKYASGHEGDAPLTGFSPRKDALAIYLATDFNEKQELLQELGKHKTGAGCLYIKKLEDVKLPVLEKLITNSVAHIRKLYPAR